MVLAALAAAVLVLVPGALGGHVTGAAFTTVNESADGAGHCQNGNPLVNCNIYDGKEYVWLNGGPSVAYLGDGSYFFAVLDPGGQHDPLDGAASNLSDGPTGDAYTNRTFSVTDGVVSYSGTHDWDGNKIRLLPYDDTTNPGGVYILAICSLKDGYDAVTPSNCKYDAFKVKEETSVPEATNPSVDKTFLGSYKTTYDWAVTKVISGDSTVHQASGPASFTYVVHVTHDAGTVGSITVSGTITATNPNGDSVSDVDVSDTLSDNTSCSVTGGKDATLAPGDNTFLYSCAIDGTAVPADLTNSVTITWPEQFLDNGDHLAAGSADRTEPTTGAIEFDNTDVGNCTTIADPTPAGGTSIDNPFQATVCAGDLGDGGAGTDPTDGFTYTYHVSYPVTAGTCTEYDNTASVSDDATSGDNSSSAAATVCGGADLTVSKIATPAFRRTYNWTIAKAVDKTLVNQAGVNVTFNYTVTVNSATPAYTDSGWTVTGTIIVHNPNDWEAITANVSDSVDNGGSCAVTNGNGVTIAKSDSVTLNYSCSYLSAPSSSSGTNTATATWDGSAANTPHSSKTGTATFDFANVSPSELHKTITVTDTFNGTLVTLGTVTYGSTTLSAVYTYAHTVPVPANSCHNYDNRAQITETGQYKDKRVTVCGRITGGLTIGFWSNNNGRAVLCAHDPAWRYLLNGGNPSNSLTYFLRSANGSFYSVSTSVSCSLADGNFAAWLLNASSTNMSYMLSAQLAGTILNVTYNGMSGGACIAGINGSPITINTLIANTITFLRNNGNTTASGTARTTATLYKNIFDTLNNGNGFAVTGC